MKLVIHTPLQTLNKAFRKEKIHREDFNHFKKELKTLIEKINEEESEEHLKYPLRDFLKGTFYNNHEINTKGKTDLGIYLDNTDKSKLGVIVETKKPSNTGDMVTKTDINKKAMHEAILYYLRERNEEKNNDIKNIIITNGYEWFIFDAHSFERLFFNSALNKEYDKWKSGQKASSNTPLFYDEIAKLFIDNSDKEISATCFDLRDYQKALHAENTDDEKKLTALYKIFSRVTLLKEPFANDSNTLDKKFYNELLYIIGLEEIKEGSKKNIRRKSKPDSGSLIENAMTTLEANEKLHKVGNIEYYGETKQEQLYNVALELVITWLNRILFLKLLEAQLVKYHQGDKAYKFLNHETIADYDELNELFFEVLAKKEGERKDYIKEKFKNIPYLNSSLFELRRNSLEDNTILISNLKDRFKLPIYSQTVLKHQGKKLGGELSTLNYLFDFLEAYDFSTEGAEEIQEENKSLINASVLGLIFEKINGYKDGSFFTPGFITMYMSRETVRRAVLQKFKEVKGFECSTIDELKDKIEDRAEANTIINSLKICDPAVGSGHFLVSVLNEIIALKSELRMLCYRNGNRIKDYKVEVANDELVVTDKQTEEIFQYHLNNKAKPIDYLQELQEALFHEKQTIIENCLFGVDINPNSVNICRLRLWIELLKNAYYKTGTQELETLPNIDINIKYGNSLICRYALDADIKVALKKSKWTIDSYRLAVMTYRNAQNKEQKREMEQLIASIKNDFESEIAAGDKRLLKLNNLKGDLLNYTSQSNIFEQTKEQKEAWNKKVKKITDEINKLETELEKIRTNKIYENAFEWRFEFPEVLNDEGDFVGFDVVIGNPPYFSISTEPSIKNVAEKYFTYSSSGDIYALFIELSQFILKDNAHATMIVSNKWMRTNYGQILRKYIVENTNPIEIIDFGQNLLFESAIVHTNILITQKSTNRNVLNGVRFPDGYFNGNQNEFVSYIQNNSVFPLNVNENVWNIIDFDLLKIKIKAEKRGVPLKKWKINFRRGILTGLNEAFIIDNSIKERLISENNSSRKFIKPILRGRDTRRYYSEFKNIWLINIPKGYTIKTNLGNTNIVLEPMPRYGNMEFDTAWQFFSGNHNAIAKHLLPFKERAIKRDDQGDFWWELRACTYISEFEKPKIIFSEIVSEPQFYYDEDKFYPEATVFFISGEKLKYLTALLNSKFITFLFKTFYMGGELVGKIRYKKAFLEQVPILVPDKVQEDKILEKVTEVINFKKQNPNSNTAKLEKEIDQIVYQLYGLTDEEIEIVENS